MKFILDLLIFLLSLSGLVLIHELGHFATAKLFGVYCREFSIGMGPLLLKYKGKNSETQFSLRAIPLGGFVSMVGEDAGDNPSLGGQRDPSQENQEELSEEELKILSLPKNRRLDGIAKWKRAIIMSAGVIMNLVLAFFLFLGMNLNVQVLNDNYRSFKSIVADSPASEAGITSDDVFKSGTISYSITIKNSNGTEDTSDDRYYKKTGSYEKNFENGTDFYNFFVDTSSYLKAEENESLSIAATDYFKYVLVTDNNEEKSIIRETKEAENEDDSANKEYTFESIGIYFHTRKYSPLEVLSNTFKDIGDSSVAIFKALGTLFTKEGLENVGGPIAIFQLSSQYTTLGIEYYCMLWGLISVNLAVMNFLPFPGLDGWHFLVLIVEGITKKEMPSKVKNIISMIGLMLLFALMILITFKDIFQLIF